MFCKDNRTSDIGDKEQKNPLFFQVNVTVSFDPNNVYKLWHKPGMTIFTIIAWPSYRNNRK